ncbi:hypothetical protein VTI28DRAFT_9238 [Corynascus sepedonium]
MFRGEETWEVMFEGVAVLKMSLSLVSNYVHYYGTVAWGDAALRHHHYPSPPGPGLHDADRARRKTVA